jgi:sucrose phosphorylase
MKAYKWENFLNEETLREVFPDTYELLAEKLLSVMKPYIEEKEHRKARIEPSVLKEKIYDEKDAIVITYGDSMIKKDEKPLKTLNDFFTSELKNVVSAVHLLPIYPFTSDDGFSVTDYLAINEDLGDWEDVDALGENFDLMLDAVINHISKESKWFKNYQKGIEPYTEFFTEDKESFDTSNVIRPRVHPLFHEFETVNGPKKVWTTFSEDQVDLNYGSIDLLVELAKVLLSYGSHGAKYIRLDAIGFIWKKSGTTCMSLKETHAVVKILRQVFDACFGDVKIVTETNVPHEENISYFGGGSDEAHMVYQFPLPPLTLFSFMKKDTTKLMEWLKTIDTTSKEATYFNFLASHDGIGMRPTEGILEDAEKDLMAKLCKNNGGEIGYKTNPDGSKTPYELNINYMDALKETDMDEDMHVKKFLASQSIILALKGIPGIYIHSLLGSGNDVEGMKSSGINRRINREKLDAKQVKKELAEEGRRSKVFSGLKELLQIRRSQEAFSPMEEQEVLFKEKELFSIVRGKDSKILVIVNVSGVEVAASKFTEYVGEDLISGKRFDQKSTILPYEILWVKLD